MNNLKPRSTRIEVVDALRGFAVMAILLVHSLEHFIFSVYPEASSQPQWLNTLDDTVFSIIFTLFAGKSYAIFALLFGFTFYIQYNNQQNKGKDFGPRFLWRMILLLAFATLNAAFFPAGDVLLLFAIVSIFLFAVRKWSNTTILITAIIFLLQPIEWFHYFASNIIPNYSIPDLNVGEMYAAISKNTKEGTFGEFIVKNITLGQKASLFWAIGAGRFLQTAGLFLLGYLIGRKKLFLNSVENTHFWVKALIVSAILFAPINALADIFLNDDSKIISSSIGVILDMWQKLAFTFVLISAFVLAFYHTAFKDKTKNLQLYGKMSLTNYITQSIGGALIYFPFGLYLAPYCGYTASLLIGILFFILQIQFCKWWLKSHKQGPLEYIWHKWTWLNSTK